MTVTHEYARRDDVCGVFCDAEPEVSFIDEWGIEVHWCRDCYEKPCSHCGGWIEDENKRKGMCQARRDEIQMWGGDEERGVEKEPDNEQTTLLTDGGRRSPSDRRCTNCGKSVEELPYEFWLFHTCRSCALDAAPERWSDTGTYRKWRYFPRWHMTRHPDLPEHVRARYEATA